MRRASHFTHVTPKLAKVPFYLGGHFSCRMPRTLVQNFVLGDMTIFIVRSHLNLYNCNTLPSELEVEESIGNLQLVIGRSRRQEDRVGMLYPFSHRRGYWYDLTEGLQTANFFRYPPSPSRPYLHFFRKFLLRPPLRWQCKRPYVRLIEQTNVVCTKLKTTTFT